jgi:hypothetical protein
VTLDAARTVGALEFNSSASYTIAGPSTLTLSATGGASINVLQGSHVIATPIALQSNLAASVVGGATLTVSGNLTAASGLSLTKSGLGTMQVNNVRAAGLTVNDGTLRIAADGSAAGVSKVGFLTLGPTARLDLNDNKLIVAGDQVAALTPRIAAGRNGGNWSGNGIVTSQSAATSTTLTSIGIATAADVRSIASTATTLWAGQTVSGADTLIMYTYAGDATLDGKINVDDYIRIDNGVASTLTGWSNGDFNYDGKVNVDDYILIDSNIANATAPIFASSSVTFATVAVPEPTLISISGVCALACPLMPRRRRRLRRLRRSVP